MEEKNSEKKERKMRDSGIPWIGEVPEGWGVNKIKYHLTRNEIKNKPDKQVLSVYRDYGVIPKDSRDDNHNVTSEDTSKYKYVQKGDLVINKMKAWQGSLGVSKYEGIVSPAYYIYKFHDDSFDGKFFHYLIRGCYKDEFRRISGGIREGQWDLSAEKFENTMIIIPPIPEQHRIADFLDSKCSEIDNLIENLRARVESAKEYKKAVITEAVTKGLDKDTKMKDSEIEWIGEMPEGWEIVPAKYLFSNSDKRKSLNDEQLTSSQKYGIITQKEYMQRENAKIVMATQGIEKWKHVEPNDFIISLRNFQGGLEMSEITGCITWHYVVLKPVKEIIPRYYKWFFKSDVYIKALQNTCNFIRDGQDLRYSNFVQVPLIDIPLKEQYKIADYLDSKCSEIDALLQNYEDQISTLEEYKKSLIYEYVTGKKEVY
ncbi:restriction endonuclease subunit S [Ruminococcus sp. AM36-17]|nr:restriction endonuclease subunit S [Ruminococcus sp. AM36-17]